LVNLLQRSRSTFSWRSFLSFFAFKDGILDTQISALGGWPTVTGRFLGHLASHCGTKRNSLPLNISPFLPESEKIIAQGTDRHFFNALKKELKG
jgi:hypothetical protein